MPLVEAIEIISGGTPKTSVAEYWGGTIPWLSVADFNTGYRWVKTAEKSITKKGFENSATSILQPHDIIISARGTVGVLSQVAVPMAFNQSCYGIRAKDRVADTDFIYYVLQHAVKEMKQVAHGGVFDTITRDTFKIINILLPPLPEQRAIARILGTLDDKIELNRRMNETLEAMARAIFKSWFVDFDPVRAKAEGRDTGLPEEIAELFPDSFEETELGEVPEGWKIGTINDCCSQIYNGGTPKRNRSQYWEEGTIPWLTSGEVRQSIITKTENFITESGLAESSAKWVPDKSTLVALYGATAGQVSFNSLPLTTNQAVCALIAKKNYVYYNYLVMRFNISELENKASGSAQQNISKKTVENTSIIIPSLSILEIFTKQVEPLFNLWESKLIENYKLAELRDTLLPKLISGELRLRETEGSLELDI